MLPAGVGDSHGTSSHYHNAAGSDEALPQHWTEDGCAALCTVPCDWGSLCTAQLFGMFPCLLEPWIEHIYQYMYTVVLLRNLCVTSCKQFPVFSNQLLYENYAYMVVSMDSE